MEKAIEIKRRAQRCIQNGDLEGALTEYEKLVGAPDADPYNYVLLADLLYKKGDHDEAAERYLAAVTSYQSASLYKNAIAVCKKMVRLSLSPAKVLQSLAGLHALDGLAGEASLYYVQYAEHLVRASAPAEAAAALRQAFDICQDNIRVLEQLSEAWLLAGDNGQAAQALMEAAAHYRHSGADADARRCEERAKKLDAGATATEVRAKAPGQVAAASAAHLPEPGAVELTHGHGVSDDATAAAESGGLDRIAGFETGRHHAPEDDDAPSDDDAPEYAPAPMPLPLGEPSADAPVDMAMEDSAGGAAAYEIGDEELDQVPVFEIAEDESEESAEVYEIAEIEEERSALAAAARAAVEGDASPAPARAGELPPIPDEVEAEVYEITEVATGPEAPDAIAAEAAADDTPAERVYDLESDAEPAVTPGAPGLAFHADGHAASAVPAPTPEERALAQVEELLIRAQDQFRTGDRDEASLTLANAAQVCESIGRLENAATIYRSLGRGPHATPSMLALWLANCERRADRAEAAQVACELGDRALNDGDEPGARGWFERAIGLDAENEMARRRLHRLEQVGSADDAGVSVTAAAPAPSDPYAVDGAGRVEVAVGRAEAVSFDLTGLLAEFQRGVAAQLAGDAQSHYDLGMTYREMGLLDQARESFEFAARDPRFASRAMEMAGRCEFELGDSSKAVATFQRALAQSGVADGTDLELRYHLGIALESTGRHDEALVEFERVCTQMPGFEDVEQRVAAMRRWLGRA